MLNKVLVESLVIDFAFNKGDGRLHKLVEDVLKVYFFEELVILDLLGPKLVAQPILGLYVKQFFEQALGLLRQEVG